MLCRQFVDAIEEHLARHPDQRSAALPADLRQHSAACRRCHRRLKVAYASRHLLATLRPDAEPAADPFFLPRLHARIQAARAARSRWLPALPVAWKDLAIAALLFVTTLGTFVFNLQRTEARNADEAMVVDVPHLNPQHPSDDHLKPRLSDVMVSLLNP